MLMCIGDKLEAFLVIIAIGRKKVSNIGVKWVEWLYDPEVSYSHIIVDFRLYDPEVSYSHMMVMFTCVVH